MTIKIVRHTWTILSGVFVLLLSIWLSGSGIAEADTPTYKWYFMFLFILWVFGFIVHFKERTIVLGVFIMLIPVVYYLILLLSAVNF